MNFDNYSIRLIQEQDASHFYRLVENNIARLEDFFAGTVSKTKTLNDTENFISEIIKKNNNKLYYPYIIIDNDNLDIVGFIDLKTIDWNLPKGELGCFIDKNYENKGISKKALLIVMDHFLNEMGFIKLFLRTHESNTSARNLAEKCGFRLEGKITNDYKTTKGEIVDLIYYGLAIK